MDRERVPYVGKNVGFFRLVAGREPARQDIRLEQATAWKFTEKGPAIYHPHICVLIRKIWNGLLLHDMQHISTNVHHDFNLLI